jgi:CheY-like chemotaxis protein
VTVVPSRVRITVSDTGQGISPEFIQHIFDPFRQAQRTHARSHEGLGLGLAIVKNLVERHQGTISCHSEGASKGSTFTVELPLLESYAASHRPSAAMPEAMAQSDRSKVFVAPLAGLHALVVEDDPDSRDLVEAVLCGFGAQVTCVDSAGAAIRALAACRPDVLVSDIGLPDEDGLSLIRRIRKMQGLEGLPAIALSAYASRHDVRQALAAGFQVHVAKPLDPDQLGTIVADTINGQEGR